MFRLGSGIHQKEDYRRSVLDRNIAEWTLAVARQSSAANQPVVRAMRQSMTFLV